MIIQMKTLWHYFLAGLKSKFWILVLRRAHLTIFRQWPDLLTSQNKFFFFFSYVTGLVVPIILKFEKLLNGQNGLKHNKRQPLISVLIVSRDANLRRSKIGRLSILHYTPHPLKYRPAM